MTHFKLLLNTITLKVVIDEQKDLQKNDFSDKMIEDITGFDLLQQWHIIAQSNIENLQALQGLAKMITLYLVKIIGDNKSEKDVIVEAKRIAEFYFYCQITTIKTTDNV